MKSSGYRLCGPKGLFTLLFIILASKLMGQSKIKVQIVDSVSNKGVEFATATLTEFGKNQVYKYDESDSTGKAEIINVAPGKYTLSINHLNYEIFKKEITISKKDVDLGNIKIKEKITSMSSVVVTAIANPIVIKKDTIEFTAAAFSVNEGDMLDQLLKKLPGLEIDNNGKMTFEGKPINKIMVDGKDFFSNDPKMISANLPAKIIEKVKVIDRKSEQSRFSGIDDGRNETIMDVTVKEGFKDGLFGNATAGYGSENLYSANLMTAKFNKKSNFAVMAGSSNVSSGMGMMMIQSAMIRGGSYSVMGGLGGKFNSNSIGLTGNTELKNGKLKIAGSYSLFDSGSESETKSTRQTFQQDTSFINSQITSGSSNNQSNRFGATLDWSPNKKFSVSFRPSFDFSKNSGLQTSEYNTKGASGIPVNSGNSTNYSVGDSKNTNGSLLLKYSFNKPRRTLSLMTEFGLSNSNDDGYNQSSTTKFNNYSQETDSVKQKSNRVSDYYTFSFRTSYTEPISSKYVLELAYRFGYSSRVSDKKTYNWNPDSEQYDLIDDVYSNYYQDINVNQNLDLNIQRTEKKYNYRIGFSIQPSLTKSKGTGRNYTNSVTNYSPSCTFRYTISPSSILSLNYRGRSSQPPLSMMQPVPDNSNPLYIRAGNPALIPGFDNNFDLSLRIGNKEKFRTFGIIIMGGYNTNGISNITAFGNGGIQYSIPVNTDPTMNSSLNFTYSTPFFNKKLSTFLTSSVYYSKNLSYTASIEADPTADPREIALENFKNISKNSTNNLSLSSSIRATYKFKKGDISVYTNISYRDTWYSVSNKSKPQIWNYTASSNIRLILPKGFIISPNVTFNMSKGYGGDKDKPYTLINGEATKSLCKNKLSLKLMIYDILNQAKGINRFTTENYIEDIEFKIQKQYVLLSLTYNFGKFPGRSGSAVSYGTPFMF